MPYFHISSGLRGCYMPDNASVCRFTTRRELLAHIEYEAELSIESYGYGYSKRDRRAIVAQVWRDAKRKGPKPWGDYVIGFGHTRAKSDRPFGLFISHATRADYLAHQSDCEG